MAHPRLGKFCGQEAVKVYGCQGGWTHCLMLMFLACPVSIVSGTRSAKHDDENQNMEFDTDANAHRISQADLASAARREADAVVESLDSDCGITGVLGGSGFVDFATNGVQAECNVSMSTNCMVSYRTIRCPEECPFKAPSSTFPCLLQCVPAERCSRANPGLGLANKTTGMCEVCLIPNCRFCRTASHCLHCVDGFLANHDGSHCSLEIESRSGFGIAISAIGMVLLGLVLLAIVWKICWGDSPYASKNRLAIRRAMKHRHMTKVQDWSSTGSLRKRFPLTINVHKEHIMGVGMALFYNNLVFLMVVAFLMMTIVFFTGQFSQLALVLGRYSTMEGSGLDNRMFLMSHAIIAAADAPAVVISPLSDCGHNSASDVEMAMRTYANLSFYGCSTMYVLLFLLSLWHGRRQKRMAQAYDGKNSTMSDYAVCLTGLSPTVTDEEELKAWAQNEVFRLQNKTQTDKESEVFGVSIGYDYLDRTQEVEAMTSRLIEKVEVDMGIYTEDMTTAAPRKLVEVIEEDKQKVVSWFEDGGPKRMLSSGEVFIVFRHKAGKNAFMEMCDSSKRSSTPLYHSRLPLDRVGVYDVRIEPVSACWWHFGVRTPSLIVRCFLSFFKMALMICAVQFFLVLPFARYIVLPYVKGGNPAGGSMFVVAGLLLGWVNMITCIQIYFISYGLGFHRKDKRDVVIFWANFILSLVNTVFQLCIMTMQEYGKGGMFFTGYLMCPLMAGVIPYIFNMLLMKVIYVWRCLPTPFLRLLRPILPWAPDSIDRYPVRCAEKGLEGMELGLPWDYASNIIVPSICCVMLPLASPWVCQVFIGLFLWAVFYYCYCRYMHLRFMRAQYYTTPRVDMHVNIAWGLPLSIVASSACIWAVRTDRIFVGTEWWDKLFLLGAVFVASWTLWVLSYLIIVKPCSMPFKPDKHDPPVEKVKAQTLYTWFNCNPVYTLKCKYLLEDKLHLAKTKYMNPIASGYDGKSVRFFEIGKEYLFLVCDKPDYEEKKARIEQTQMDNLEIETYLDCVIYWLEGEKDQLESMAEAMAKQLQPVTESAAGASKVAREVLENVVGTTTVSRGSNMLRNLGNSYELLSQENKDSMRLE